MKVRVERLRMGLVAATLLLMVAVAGTLTYSKYRAGKLWFEKAKKRSGVSLERETDGFTYSQSMQGKTIFTLHAAKAFQHKGGIWTLHDVVLTLYGLGGEKPDRADRIYGNEFEWDENKGVARAVGEVQMDLEVPAGMAMNERHGAAGNAGVAAVGGVESIHIRTSNLVFLRQLGVGATEEPIEFRYGGMTCMARGAEFNSSPSSVHLLAEVKAQGMLRGQPVMLTAARADFDRTTDVLALKTAFVSEQRGSGHAANALLHLRRDGSVATAEAVGGVALDSAERHVTAGRLDAVFGEKSEPQTARFTGGVQLLDDSRTQPSKSDAGEMLVRFDGRGRPAEMTAVGGTHLVAKRQVAHGLWLQRDVKAQSLVATMAANGTGNPQLRKVHATGAVTVRADSVSSGVGQKAGTGVKTNFAAADDLTAMFAIAGRRAVLQSLHGQGNTKLRQTGDAGEEHVSSGDVLDVEFATGTGAAEQQMAVRSAEQKGHVTFLSKNAAKPGAVRKAETELSGSAERADYDAGSEALRLIGNAHLVDGRTSLSAAAVDVNQLTGDAEARGHVVGTLAGKDAQATHVTAGRALMHHASQVAEFFAGEGGPARLWQEASQVQAGVIVLDAQQRRLTARPGRDGAPVQSVFAGGAGAGSGSLSAKETGKGGRGPSVMRVESAAMEYAEEQHVAVFPGPVKIDGMMGEVRARRADVRFLAGQKVAGDGMEAAMPAGGLERVTVSGDVRLNQPGRQGFGERLEYKAADGSFVLTGTEAAAPKIVDAQQGSVTGVSLLFRAGDSTIVVAGGPGAGGSTAGGKQPRARIETRVRQKSE